MASLRVSLSSRFGQIIDEEIVGYYAMFVNGSYSLKSSSKSALNHNCSRICWWYRHIRLRWLSFVQQEAECRAQHQSNQSTNEKRCTCIGYERTNKRNC